MGDQGGPDSGCVDLEVMVNDFLRDPSSSSMQLPQSLSADQRKEARRLVDQHPQLKCESYGFGEERRLHVFKKIDQDRVRVKNTFIDDWEGAEKEAPAFRSMPPTLPQNLLERTLQRCMGGVAEVPSLPPTQECAGPDTSPICSMVELPPLPGGFQIRNTFIHIEEMPAVERIVQSMPHGMFRQCLEAELSAQSPSPAPGSAPKVPVMAPAATVPATPAPLGPPTGLPTTDDGFVLLPGTEVQIQNLVKLPDFNGLMGVVQSFDPESGRYDVLLDGPAGQCGWRWVKVKGENCRPCMPPPPRNAPTLSMDEAGEFPPTPKWDEDYAQAATTLKLNALV